MTIFGCLSCCFNRFRRDRRGTSAVEFAILSPVFLLLLMGMTAYGIYFGASHSVQQIAADAARAAVAGLTTDERRTIATGYINANAHGYPFVDPRNLAVDVEDTEDDGTLLTVSILYDARDLPIWNLFTGLPLPDMTIARRSAIRIGGI